MANELMKPILLRKSDDLNGATRNHLEALKQWAKEEGKTSFGNRETSRYFRKPIATIKRYHHQLVELGYLATEKQKDTKTYSYKLTTLASDDTRTQTIERALEQALYQIESKINGVTGSNGSPSAQYASEPPKALKTSKKKASAQ
jgi:flagellar motor component MotA